MRIQAENLARELVKANQGISFYAIAGALFLSLSLNGLLAYAFLYRYPIKQYLWTNDAKAVCEATPLSEPNTSAARIKNFASTVAIELNTYGYGNWRIFINRALETYFTAHGRRQYEDAFSRTGVIEDVVRNYQEVNAQNIAPAKIVEEGRVSGRYVWVVQVPLTIFYQTTIETKKENRLLTMTIIRVDPSPENPNGVAVDGLSSSQLLVNQLNQINSGQVRR